MQPPAQILNHAVRQISGKDTTACTHLFGQTHGHKTARAGDLVGAYPTCSSCGSRKVVRDAWTGWNFAAPE